MVIAIRSATKFFQHAGQVSVVHRDVLGVAAFLQRGRIEVRVPVRAGSPVQQPTSRASGPRRRAPRTPRRMVQASSGDRVLAITEIADDLGDDDFVEDTDQPVDVDLVADGEGTGLHVAAGPAPLGPSCRHD